MRKPVGRVLFVGHVYYSTWYLSRELRKLGWKADILNWDPDVGNEMYYHGEDYRFRYGRRFDTTRQLGFLISALLDYDIFHFSNAHGMIFGQPLHEALGRFFGSNAEIRLLKRLGKKIVYSNNGCLDGVSQTSFANWGGRPVCDDCSWRDVPDVCSDARNLAWGEFRNRMADLQTTLGGNRADYNDDPSVREVPEFYCLDPDYWRPGLEIPERFRLPRRAGLVRIFHVVGNHATRTDAVTGRNIKSSHVWIPLVDRLRGEGYDVELFSPRDVPNRELRFYQAQSDIFADMLSFGFYGATAREGMMLGKPVVGHLRDEWLGQMREQIPDYVDEIPVVEATEESVYDVVKNLLERPEERVAAGRRSREFALRWHSADVGARRMDAFYRELLP